MRLFLAPMEGLLDFVLRDVLTRVGARTAAFRFIRVSGSILPDRVFLSFMPELLNGSKTLAGVPVRAQLLGSDPDYMAANAANLARLNPEGIDLNFGCPAKTVNRHGGGASMLQDLSRSPGWWRRCARLCLRTCPCRPRCAWVLMTKV